LTFSNSDSSTEARTRQAVAVQGHRPEHAGLVTQHRQVADRHPAVGEHHRQISQHPARRIRRTTLTATADCAVECLRDTSRSSDVGEQP
jgi:hypothetical protein